MSYMSVAILLEDVQCETPETIIVRELAECLEDARSIRETQLSSLELQRYQIDALQDDAARQRAGIDDLCRSTIRIAYCSAAGAALCIGLSLWLLLFA